MSDNPISAVLATLPGNTTPVPEKREPGPGDVGPSTQTKSKDLVTLPMTEGEVADWWKRIDRARQRREKRELTWDILLNEYLPTVSKSGDPETVKVQAHFRNVHSKIGQLFYRSPDLILSPRDPSPAQNTMPNPMGPMAPPLTMEDIISVKQAVLTEKLGRDGIKVNRLMDELLMDNLTWAGIGCSKLGYRCVMKTIQTPVLQPDPTHQAVAPAGSAAGLTTLGLGPSSPPPPMVPAVDPATGQPQMQSEEVPIFEEWYWRRFSPKKVLFNDDLRSTRFDEDATWTGMEFFMSPKAAMAQLGLTEDEAATLSQDDRIHDYADGVEGEGMVHGVELTCKASYFTDELHPQLLNQLVLVEGIKDRPIVWRPSPDQETDPKTGKLTKDSLIGFPIRILTIRDLPDSPFPPADSAFTNSEIKQLSTWRRQSIKIRDAQIGKYLYDGGMLDENDIEKIKNGEIGDYIQVKEGALANGSDKIITTTAGITQTRDDYQGAELIKRDIDETLGIGSNQSGTPENTVRTATEIANVQTAVAARNDKELGRVIDFYLDGARMIDQLLMRYATNDEYIEIVGQEGAKRLQMWNNQMITGRYLYDIAPDSQMRVDTAADFKHLLDLYNMGAKDPLFNRKYALQKLARMRGLDPMKAIMPPSPPPPPVPPVRPSVALSFKGEDFMNPALTGPLTDILKEAVTPVAQTPPAQPIHGGPGEAVNQHQASNSGNRPSEPGMPNHRTEQPK